MMAVLPNAENVIIPIEKFTEYALHPVRSKGKHIVFERALGYNLSNAELLKENIRANIRFFEANPTMDNGYGQKYEVIMSLRGENGNIADVFTCWIVEHGTEEPRLVTTYVTKRGYDD